MHSSECSCSSSVQLPSALGCLPAVHNYINAQVGCSAACHAAPSGSTDTSLWTHYAAGAREYCGNSFPDGMRKNDRCASLHPAHVDF